MHRIDWTQKGEHFTVVTDGSIEDALALMVNARANIERERDEATKELLGDAATVLGKLADHLTPNGQ